VLITNTERASAAFSGAPGALRPYIEALNRCGLTVVLTAHGRGRENKKDCDLVFAEVPDADVARPVPLLRCESVRSPAQFPGLAPGVSFLSVLLDPPDAVPRSAQETPVTPDPSGVPSLE